MAADRDAAKDMIAKTGQMAVPAIIIDDKEIIVGFNTAKLDEVFAGGK